MAELKTDTRVREAIKRYNKRFPEMIAARSAVASRYLAIHKPLAGIDLHHWSYNEQHYLDVIKMSRKDHKKLHRYMVYDPVAKMYRDKRSNYLLDTKAKHAAYIDLILTSY